MKALLSLLLLSVATQALAENAAAGAKLAVSFDPRLEGFVVSSRPEAKKDELDFLERVGASPELRVIVKGAPDRITIVRSGGAAIAGGESIPFVTPSEKVAARRLVFDALLGYRRRALFSALENTNPKTRLPVKLELRKVRVSSSAKVVKDLGPAGGTVHEGDVLEFKITNGGSQPCYVAVIEVTDESFVLLFQTEDEKDLSVPAGTTRSIGVAQMAPPNIATTWTVIATKKYVDLQALISGRPSKPAGGEDPVSVMLAELLAGVRRPQPSGTSAWGTASVKVLIESIAPVESGPPKDTSPISYDERTKLFDAARKKQEELGCSEPVALVRWLNAQPRIEAAGLSAMGNNVWFRFTDGRMTVLAGCHEPGRR